MKFVKKITSKLCKKIPQKTIDLRPNPLRERNPKYIDISSLGEIVNYYPGLIYAEISTICDMNCYMCGKSYYKDDLGLMDLSIFKKLIPLLSKNTHLSLFGRGESLVHPDFIKFIKLSKYAQSPIAFHSNGKRLSKTISEALVKYREDVLVISISAGREKSYNEIHKGGSFKNLIENLITLNEFKIKYSSHLPIVRFSFVAMRRNIEELPDLITLAKKLNVEGITVSYLVPHGEKMEKEESLFPSPYKEKMNKIFEESKKLAKELKIDLLLPFQDEEDKNLPLICPEPWQTFYVRYTGEVTTCCITNRIFGNLNSSSPLQIWNGEVYQKFRARMKSGNLPPECKLCHFFSKEKFNTKLEDKEIYNEQL